MSPEYSFPDAIASSPPAETAPADAARETSPEAAASNGEDGGLPLYVPLSGGALVLLAGAGLAVFAIRRRMERERRGREELREALTAARQVFASVIFGDDKLAFSEPQEAERFQLQASDLSDRLDALEREADDPVYTSPAVLLGRGRQLENELRVLSSTLLQKRSQEDAQELKSSRARSRSTCRYAAERRREPPLLDDDVES